MDSLKPFLSLFVKDECFNILFKEWNLFHVPCLTAALSKVLGYLIIAGAVLVKLPQIIKIVKSKSAEGISFAAICLELFAISSMLAYSLAYEFPFTTWGDSFFLMIQVSIISGLVLYYKGRVMQSVAFMIFYYITLYILTSGITPVTVLAALQASNMPAVVIAKLIQALECYRNGHSGQLSAITVFLTTLGSVARIFTSMQETGDQLVITTYIVGTFANGLIAFQILYYWNATNKYLKNKENKSQ